LVAFAAALLVWGIWYPQPYDKLSGGRELFFLVIAVDVICGPALTLIVFDKTKPRGELLRDLAIIGLLQCGALLYGVWTVYEARPLYLVHEVDRFRVIARPDYLGVDVTQQLDELPQNARPKMFSGPALVGIRAPKDIDEHSTILFEAVGGGRDFSQRPEFYVPYDDAYALKVMRRAKPLALFLGRYPASEEKLNSILRLAGLSMPQAYFLPVVHRQEWIAILNAQGSIVGFVPGDGFEVR
jgi:hypothetical protein